MRMALGISTLEFLPKLEFGSWGNAGSDEFVNNSTEESHIVIENHDGLNRFFLRFEE
jgi:hypothetical protein